MGTLTGTTMKRKAHPYSAIGHRLQELREASGASLIEVAAEAGISRQQLWRIETGLSMNPSVSLLMKLAAVYKIDLATITRPRARPSNRTLLIIAQHIEKISGPERDLLDALAKQLVARADNTDSASPLTRPGPPGLKKKGSETPGGASGSNDGGAALVVTTDKDDERHPATPLPCCPR